MIKDVVILHENVYHKIYFISSIHDVIGASSKSAGVLKGISVSYQQ